MKVILWISIVLATALLYYLDPWNSPPLNCWLIAVVVLGGPVTGTILLFRWIDEKAAKKELCFPRIPINRLS